MRYFQPFIAGVILLASCNGQRPKEAINELQKDRPETEILYHVCQRSFYDSNGDYHGDLAGLEQKLDYLQDLGITSILLLPLYDSEFYHNYFPTDFMKIDEEFGTKEQYLSLVKAVHGRGMKIYMDMEVQYITEDHLWYKDSYRNPESEYSDYIIYNDSLNAEPEPIVYDLASLTGYDGTTKKVTTLNLYNEKAKQYIYGLFHHWVDPNNDGEFDDGVDGFRIDHMMDDLDGKGILTDMFANFWKPLFAELRAVNNNIIIMGEQADWGDIGIGYLTEAQLDWVFAFWIKFGVANFNKQEIIHNMDTIFSTTPEDKNQIIFIENHDVHRFASLVEGNIDKLKVGAAFNLLLKGIPSIYYGQEIGMAGKADLYPDYMDGNHIPVREAFEWYKVADPKEGMAFWYKDSGPWWDASNVKDSDGVSVEEQRNDSTSLWSYYRKLIALRKNNRALSHGDLIIIDHDNPEVVSFSRSVKGQELLVHINLSDKAQAVKVGNIYKKLIDLHGGARYELNDSETTFHLKPYGVQVIEKIE